MKISSPELEQADSQVHLLRWEPTVSLGGSLRVETEGYTFKVRCDQCKTLQTPRLRYDEKHHEFVANCPACGTRWEKMPAYGYESKNSRSGWDGGARVRGLTTRGGQRREAPDQRVYVNPTRPHKGSFEHRIFGTAETAKLHALKQIEARLWESHYRWPSRLYFTAILDPQQPTVLEFIREARKRLWFDRSKDRTAAEREIDWSPTNVQECIGEGRHQWAVRLKAERLLWGEIRE